MLETWWLWLRYGDTCLFQCFKVGVYACMHVCAPHIRSACGGQEKASDPQELEFQSVANYHVGSGNQTRVFWKGSQCSHQLNQPQLSAFLDDIFLLWFQMVKEQRNVPKASS